MCGNFPGMKTGTSSDGPTVREGELVERFRAFKMCPWPTPDSEAVITIANAHCVKILWNHAITTPWGSPVSSVLPSPVISPANQTDIFEHHGQPRRDQGRGVRL